ncbi:DinB family protein [Adhaeribacter arboris]|uniref:DinB family protein n=1 Tax=Adhaeribacter arboris TaxID=2072846 RepID=UPI001E2ED9AD|nr:DinB family protein [Adhaeribacter arboris]
MPEIQTLSVLDLLPKELAQEAETTRKMLSRIPDDKYDWQPHPKSMTIKQLATHIADLPSWITMALNTDELDFSAQPYTPTEVKNTAELLQILEKSIASGTESLSKATEEDLLPTWTLRDGEQVYAVYTKYEVIRHALSQLIHHRAQLGVYLRLLNIPIPGSYGPSADEMNF